MTASRLSRPQEVVAAKAAAAAATAAGATAGSAAGSEGGAQAGGPDAPLARAVRQRLDGIDEVRLVGS